MTDEQSNGITVRKNPETGRYEGYLGDEQVGFADYREGADGVVTMPHTVVPEQFGGRGYASAIVRFALDDIRDAGRRVNPTCPYVASWIDKHPDYADLRV